MSEFAPDEAAPISLNTSVELLPSKPFAVNFA